MENLNNNKPYVGKLTEVEILNNYRNQNLQKKLGIEVSLETLSGRDPNEVIREGYVPANGLPKAQGQNNPSAVLKKFKVKDEKEKLEKNLKEVNSILEAIDKTIKKYE